MRNHRKVLSVRCASPNQDRMKILVCIVVVTLMVSGECYVASRGRQREESHSGSIGGANIRVGGSRQVELSESQGTSVRENIQRGQDGEEGQLQENKGFHDGENIWKEDEDDQQRNQGFYKGQEQLQENGESYDKDNIWEEDEDGQQRNQDFFAGSGNQTRNRAQTNQGSLVWKDHWRTDEGRYQSNRDSSGGSSNIERDRQKQESNQSSLGGEDRQGRNREREKAPQGNLGSLSEEGNWGSYEEEKEGNKGFFDRGGNQGNGEQLDNGGPFSGKVNWGQGVQRQSQSNRGYYDGEDNWGTDYGRQSQRNQDYFGEENNEDQGRQLGNRDSWSGEDARERNRGILQAHKPFFGVEGNWERERQRNRGSFSEDDNKERYREQQQSSQVSWGLDGNSGSYDTRVKGLSQGNRNSYGEEGRQGIDRRRPEDHRNVNQKINGERQQSNRGLFPGEGNWESDEERQGNGDNDWRQNYQSSGKQQGNKGSYRTIGQNNQEINGGVQHGNRGSYDRDDYQRERERQQGNQEENGEIEGQVQGNRGSFREDSNEGRDDERQESNRGFFAEEDNWTRGKGRPQDNMDSFGWEDNRDIDGERQQENWGRDRERQGNRDTNWRQNNQDSEKRQENRGSYSRQKIQGRERGTQQGNRGYYNREDDRGRGRERQQGSQVSIDGRDSQREDGGQGKQGSFREDNNEERQESNQSLLAVEDNSVKPRGRQQVQLLSKLPLSAGGNYWARYEAELHKQVQNERDCFGRSGSHQADTGYKVVELPEDSECIDSEEEFRDSTNNLEGDQSVSGIKSTSDKNFRGKSLREFQPVGQFGEIRDISNNNSGQVSSFDYDNEGE